MIRQPIVTIMGHVDHGKTSLLDKIRGSAVAVREAGGITQAIGASIIPLSVIRKICGVLLEKLKLEFTIPGLLFIDTPGHAAFTNLRKRGGNLADIAILVVALNEGFMPQTLECIGILKSYKIPFVVAVTKIDLVDGWRQNALPLVQSIASQSPRTLQLFENHMYEIVGRLFDAGFESERFDRVADYTKQISIVPVSSKTGEGIAELLMVIAGLAQKFLGKKLEIDAGSGAKGTVLELKEEKGVGVVADSIIYDGSLRLNDTIVIGTLDLPVVVKVKALLLPAPLMEMRDVKAKFIRADSVTAATGVRIVAQGMETVVSGMPVIGARTNAEINTAKAQVLQEIKSVIVETAQKGIIIKADSLGSLEALNFLLKEKNIPVCRASVGSVTKKDVSDAEANSLKDPLTAVILAFNVPVQEIVSPNVRIISGNIIYRLIEDYEKWLVDKKRAIEIGELEALVRPAKIQLLKGYVFRQSNPAVVGIEVMAGTLKTNVQLMNGDGKILSVVKGIQLEQENLAKAEKGQRVAISMPNVVVGRQVQEGDILYSAVPEAHFRIFKEFKQYLSSDEKELLKAVAEIMRKNNPVWGV